jgi:hypothetical protein
MKFYQKIVSIILLFISFALYAQQPTEPQNQPTQPTQPSREDVQSQSPLVQVDLEDFEEAEDWYAKSTSPLGETKTLKLVQRGEIRATDDENMRPPEGEALSVEVDPNNPNHILGVKTYFVDRGFDRVEVKPPHPYVLKGKVRQFSIWVLGRNYRHTMYLKIRDYRGTIHKIRLGRLDFFGWRKFTVAVPGWIPQSTRFALIDKNLQFLSIFVVSDTHEVGGEFYFYVDGLKALVDKSELVYPGSEIKDNW